MFSQRAAAASTAGWGAPGWEWVLGETEVGGGGRQEQGGWGSRKRKLFPALQGGIGTIVIKASF